MDNCLDNYQTNDIFKWKVVLSREAGKVIKTLPKGIVEALYTLIREMRISGPYRNNWRNYGKFKGCKNIFHCHINNGRPRYVVCWEVMDKKEKLIEVYYVGTHEKAPY